MNINMKSLKVVLSLTVACIIIILTVSLIAGSYLIAYNAVKISYLNQLSNFNSDFSRQLVNFYEQQMNNCRYLAASKDIKEAVASGKYGVATDMMTTYFNEIKLYENVFISTAEDDAVLVADGMGGKSVGLHWKGTGFDDNLNEALKGNIHISEPYKSPINGKGVVLITNPIVINGKVRGIMGLACDIGTFSNNLVGNTLIGKTGYPFITTLKGLVFAHPKSEFIYKLDMSKEEWGKKIFEKKMESDVIEYSFQGKPKILSYLRNDKYKFITCVTIYVSDINEKVNEMAVIMILVGIAGIFVFGGIIYYVIAKRLNPLEECKNVMNAMAMGKLNIRYTGKNSGDEISEIASGMNNALDQFEKLIFNIKMSSQNLTQAVQEIASGNDHII